MQIKRLKGCENITSYRANIAYTLTAKHQLQNSDRLLCAWGIELNNVVLGPTIPISECSDANLVPVQFRSSIFIYKWVITDGIELRKNVVIADVKYDLAVFGIVVNIVTGGWYCWFIDPNIWYVVSWYPHCIVDSNRREKTFVFYIYFQSHMTTFLVTITDGKLYVPLRFCILVFWLLCLFLRKFMPIP